MIIHVDTQRDTSTPDQWFGIHTYMVGFMFTESTVIIENQPERMLAVIVNVGRAARKIEYNGYLKNNKILIQDDRDEAAGSQEQFQLFEMLVERRKKLLTLGGNYAKYLSAVVALIRYWRIAIGLTVNTACENCQLPLEAYQVQCGACGVRHGIDWRKMDQYYLRLNKGNRAPHNRGKLVRSNGLTWE